MYRTYRAIQNCEGHKQDYEMVAFLEEEEAKLHERSRGG